MSVNRFYTPSIPQYTSQFVEEKMPWEERSAFQDMKMQRADKANKEAANTNAMMASLMPGDSTREMSQTVGEKYKGKLDEWHRKYGQQTYSIPALKDLTRIRGEWENDQDVKSIMLDREATPGYRQNVQTADQRDINPNVNQETGELKQLQPGEQWQPYDAFIREDQHGQLIRQAYRDKETTVTSFQTRRWLPGQTPEDDELEILINQRREVRGDTELDPIRDDITKRILAGQYQGSEWIKATLGEDFTEEGVKQYLNTFKDSAIVDKTSETGQQLTGGSRAGSGSTKPQDIPPGTVKGLNRAIAPQFNGPSIVGSEGGASGKDKRQVKAKSRKVGRLDEVYLSHVQREDGVIDPNKLTEKWTINVDGEMLNPLGKDDSRTSRPIDTMEGMVYSSLDGNYSKTKAEYTNFYNKYDSKKEYTDAGEEGNWGNYKYVRDELDDIFEKYDKAMGYDEPNKELFTSQLTSNGMTNSVIKSNALYEDPDAPFGEPGEDKVAAFRSIKPEDYNDEQRVWASRIVDNYAGNVESNIISPDMFTLTEPQKDWLNNTFFDNAVSNGKSIVKEGSMTEAMLSSKWILVNGPSRKDRKAMKTPEYISVEEKRKVIKDNAVSGNTEVGVTAFIDDRTNSWGPGMFSMTVGKNIYMIEGPAEVADPGRLINNAYSHERAENLGNGNIFAFDGYTPNRDANIIDQWNMDEKQAGPNATWMQTIEDLSDNTIKLLIYNSDPRGNENPKETEDYQSFTLYNRARQDITTDDMEVLIESYYLSDQLQKMGAMYKSNPDPDLLKSFNLNKQYLTKLVASYPHLFETKE